MATTYYCVSQDAIVSNLINAMVLQACNDYFVCTVSLARGKNCWNHIPDCTATLQEVEAFFKSRLYTEYIQEHPELSAKRVLARLDEMAKQYTEKKIRMPLNVHAAEDSSPISM
jgi:hypothetical protein